MFKKTVDWQTIATQISKTTGQSFQVQTQSHTSGGCINDAYRIEGNGQSYFVKLNDAQYLDMFKAEAAGLTELGQHIKVPKPLCWGSAGGNCYLVMEYLSLRGDSHSISEALGQQLAALHQATQPQFGWHSNNYIGSTPQINTLENDWVTFWQNHRLAFQLKLTGNKKLQSQGERLIADVGQFFTDYQPQPSLLHGDLWSGNYAAQGKQPVIYDPAMYYGDREADIAMTELFGGFPRRFYDAYQETWPLDPGYSTRKILYNLYHILNHLNLFGGGYLGQAERMIASLLSELC